MNPLSRAFTIIKPFTKPGHSVDSERREDGR